MKKYGSFAVLLAVALTAGAASAEVGKQTSTVSGGSQLCGGYPTMSPYMTVAVPTSYKSKKNFLKITTTMQVSCTSSDYMSTGVTVGGIAPVLGAALPFETFDEDATAQMVTRTYYMLPESLGGPAIAPGSDVVVTCTSGLGTGCTVNEGTAVIEVTK